MGGFMRKTAVILCVMVLFLLAACVEHRSPAAAVLITEEDETPQNNGRIQSVDMQVYAGITVTSKETYYYTSSGRIKRTDASIFSMPATVSREYSYDAQGRLILENNVSGDDYFYTYNSSGHIASCAIVLNPPIPIRAIPWT